MSRSGAEAAGVGIIEHLFDSVARMALESVRRALADLSPAERQQAVRAVVGDHAPLTLARERTLPVHPVLQPLVPALTRGHTVQCTGTAAMSCALALMVAPTQAGSWAGVVGMPELGVAAATELGVVVSRTVFVSALADADAPNALSALVDGVDVVVLSRAITSSLSPSLARRLQTRVQSRGGVLVVVGSPGALSVDVQLTSTVHEWEGLGAGHGHLQRRRVSLQLDGRRQVQHHDHRGRHGQHPGHSARHDVWLPGPSGALESIVHEGIVVPLRRTG